MQVRANWKGKRHFEASGGSGYSVSMDASQESGGEGKGARPMEMLLMGLAGCTGIDISMILERMRQSVESFDIEVDGERRDSYPQAFTKIDLTYRLTGAIDAAKAWRAIDLSENKYCSASASLAAPITPHLVLNGVDVPRPQSDEDTSNLPD